ncbi:SRPBCC domain-containing protein [Chitinophaga sp. GCM10012297]|uniref:SRPBCC domain-containing protein n=1 Tax=Chitinophaga chungangae TaxID=2821488 RepID=A0ABS3YBR1_9BACT|nr:SRPBCC domain-containing protein [Chitinophaga chungangae]MBO9152100.1 SRPBCC domain-containing protein [Chitinophaga chungangae]
MQQLTFNITIDAPREKVWNVLWGKDSYPEWTRAFSETSGVETDWKKGSKVRFVDANNEGMVSRISDAVPNEYMEITHEGVIKNGQEDFSTAEAEGWAGAKEIYTLKDDNGKTELLIHTDITDEYADMFKGMWPKALDEVKRLSEN